jgi:hypothetical protein
MIVDNDPFNTDSMTTSSSLQEKKDLNDCTDETEMKIKRSLNFHHTTTILWIEGTENMSETEIDACYYNYQDYSCFRDRERRISRNFSNWGYMKGGRNGEEYLGVESRLQRFHRRQRSKNAIFAVILEQELRQENAGKDDSLPVEELGIARVYQQYTKESARLAIERAAANASQVERTAPSSFHNRTISKEKMELENGEGEKCTEMTHSQLPWDVPAFDTNSTNKNRPRAMIKYSTSSHPTLPDHYVKQDTFMKHSPNSREFSYEQRKFDDKKMKHRDRIEEAPFEHKFIQSQTYHQSAQDMSSAFIELQSSQQNGAINQNYPGAITQQWTWNPSYCDVIPPTNAPRLLTWNVY